MTKKLVIIIAAIAVVVASYVAWEVLPNKEASFGAVSGNLLENNLPYVLYNGGTNTALPIQTSSTITGIGTGTSGLFTWLGTILTNNFVQAVSGYSLTISTTNTITAAQFCGVASILIPPTATAAFTITLPSATSTRLTCGASLGSFANQLIDNESSVVVTIATTTGEIVNQGVQMQFASTTGQAASASFGGLTATGVAIPATSTLQQIGIYTGTSTTNVKLNILNTLYARQ